MPTRREMFAVCGATAVAAALPGKEVKASKKAVVQERLPPGHLTTEEWLSQYGEECAREHPLTEKGRLIRDSGADINKFIEEHYPDGKVIEVKSLKSYIDFDHKGGPRIKQDFDVLVEVPGHKPFTCSTSFEVKLDFMEKLHIWDKGAPVA